MLAGNSRLSAFIPLAGGLPASSTRLAPVVPISLKRRVVCSARASSPASKELDAALKQAIALNPQIGAFTTIDADAAQDAAARSPGVGPFHGIPIAVKDNLCTKGIPTSASSRILENYVPPYTATAVRRLEEAGAVVFGKTNMDEYGMGSSTETSAFGPTRNPWDLNRVPGGSSGGSAAAVAAGVCDIALGSDTGGSIRQPASFCGVTGLKPSYGRVSRHGLLAYASSLDTVGPITRTVLDAAKVLHVIAGHDPMDSTSVRAEVPDYCDALTAVEGGVQALEGVTVGVLSETMTDAVEGDVHAAVKDAISVLESLGANVRMVSMEGLSAATAAYYVLAPSEASANLARYDGVRYGVRDFRAETAADIYTKSRAGGLGAEVKRRIMIGTYALSTGYYDAYYLRAQRVRTRISQGFRKLFQDGLDVLVSPVAPTTAFELGSKIADPVSMYLDDLMTIPASLAGLPALSVPCGVSAGNLPIGMQLIGPYLDEAAVLKVGHAFQLATSHHLQKSPIAMKVPAELAGV